MKKRRTATCRFGHFLLFFGALCVGLAVYPACSSAEVYGEVSPAIKARIQRVLDRNKLEHVRPLVPCDYSSLAWSYPKALKTSRFVGNVSLGGLLSYMIGAGVGLKTAGMTTQAAAGSTFSGALLDNFLQSIGINVSEYFLDRNVDDLIAGIEFLKSRWGISDHFVFVPTAPKDVSLSVTPIVPFGADVRIQFCHKGLFASSQLPVFLLREPSIDTGVLMGAQIQEYDINGKVRATTVPFVFASERCNGKWVTAGRGKSYQKVRVSPDDPLEGTGRLVGKIALSHVPGAGWGGLREIRLSSPINRGLAYGSQNGDNIFALVLNRDTLTVQRIKEPRPVGKAISLGFHIRGFHNHRAFVTGPDGRRYRWRDIANQALESVSCTGAGIAKTYYSHNNQYSMLSFTPTKPGKVDVRINTFHGPVVIPGVVTVGEQAPFEGLWKVQNNGSVIRIVYVPGNETFRGVLEVDRLQYFEAGDLMWRDLTPGPHSLGNVLFGKEVRGDGRGGLERSKISLELLDKDTLIYKEGQETHALIRVPDSGRQ